MNSSAARGQATLTKLRAFKGLTIREAAQALGLGTEQISRLNKKHGLGLVVAKTDLLPKERLASGKLRIKSDALTPAILREWLHYDHATGIFTWKNAQRDKTLIGQVAGCVAGNGYLVIGFLNAMFSAHRLAWFYVHGKWPVALIDHKDGNPLNNTIDNLREATALQSVQNRRVKGYSFCRRDNIFKAFISVGGERIALGAFKTKENARAAYLAASQKYYGEFSIVTSRGVDQ